MAAVEWATFHQLKGEIGSGFDRILGYFREDGVKSLGAIEEAMRRRDAVALVRPAHTLKGESLQFGAVPLGRLAEQIERGARRAVETHDTPDDLMPLVAQLRPLLLETLTVLEGHATGTTAAPATPPATPDVVVPLRRPTAGGFGRRSGSFGRG